MLFNVVSGISQIGGNKFSEPSILDDGDLESGMCVEQERDRCEDDNAVVFYCGI